MEQACVGTMLGQSRPLCGAAREGTCPAPGHIPTLPAKLAGIDSRCQKARQRDSHLSQGVSRSCTPEDTASAGCQQRQDTVCGEGLWG